MPEAWAGSLETAKVVFLSSNPSISAGEPEARARYKHLAELYPTVEWSDDLIADFMLHRFDSKHSWVNEALQHLKSGASGEPAANILRRVASGESVNRGRTETYWQWIRNQTQSLVGEETPWHENVAMTEVVHCKSKVEHGVREAAHFCSNKHMDRVLAACPAGLIVVVGGPSRDAFLLAYPEIARQFPLFGRDDRATGRVDPVQSIVEVVVGRRSRLACFLWHNSAYAPKIKDLKCMYPEDFFRLQHAALTSEPSRAP
ncbi:hypothetical protein [Arthrobacter zhaoguopingii]|uniref:hypothetical protein n=1 Tax=Arthrobacter zhaoguopingii TaxID=2681491 RepID=UPI0013570AF0|nr:hypothetical protein [Arthrobacter zhaoguopingii]